MATKKSSKKGLSSASKKTRTKVARKGGKSQEKNKQCREKRKKEEYQLEYENKDRKIKSVTKIFFLLFCIIPLRKSCGQQHWKKKKTRQMATKSKAAIGQHTLFIFLFSVLLPGLLPSLNKHKNDCRNTFCKDRLFFISITTNFCFIIGIPRG